MRAQRLVGTVEAGVVDATWQVVQRSTRSGPKLRTIVCSICGRRAARAARAAGLSAIFSACSKYDAWWSCHLA